VRALGEQRDLLRRWAPVLATLSQQSSQLDLGALAGAGPVLTGACLLLPNDAKPLPEPPAEGAFVAARCELQDHRVLFALLEAGGLDRLCAEVQASSGACLPMPDWFRGTAAACAAELPFRATELERERDEVERELRRLADARGLDQAAGVLERIDWFRDTARHIECDGRYCWITGWTSEQDEAAMQTALREAGVKASVQFGAPPADAALPSVMGTPRWSRPFGVLTRAVGTPGPTEVDPTAWVALLVPLLFGYMCGDVGHGAVIAAVGLLLRGRVEQWPLLVVCGLASMGFGVLFGDVFGYEHLIEPLWLRPLEAPLTVLLVPLPFGALVLTVGLLLHVVQSCWRGHGGSEGVADAAQLLVYWGILLALVDVAFLWLLLAGIALCLGNRLWIERSPLALLGGLGHLAESTFTLLLNTLSFARVGAFALAHAAFESAVVTLGEAAPGALATIVVIALGNLVVIVVEGLVVSIQTTRLVLFEFFIRFFEGGGRRFEPARRPPAGGE
jgi:V/A-type H+-transporting ATPase subunit I